MLSKAHLISHFRMSGSRWVITPSWLSEYIVIILYSSSVYSCYLFLISSASVRSITFLSFIEPSFMKFSLGISNFLGDISSLSHSVFLYFFALIAEEGFLSLFAILWNSAFRWKYLSFSPLFFTSLAEAETPILWPPHAKSSLTGKVMLGGIGARRRRGLHRMRWLNPLPTGWTWVWVNSGSWWWIGRPGMLRFMGSQRVRHDWVTELNWT